MPFSKSLTRHLAKLADQQRAAKESTRRVESAKRKKKKAAQPDREGEFALMLRGHGIGGWTRQWRFHHERQWRFDFAWVEHKFAVEIDGGIFQGGRHVRPAGLKGDYEKMQAALDLGWVVFRIYPDLIPKIETIHTVRRYVGDGGPMPPEQARLEMPSARQQAVLDMINEARTHG